MIRPGDTVPCPERDGAGVCNRPILLETWEQIRWYQEGRPVACGHDHRPLRFLARTGRFAKRGSFCKHSAVR